MDWIDYRQIPPSAGGFSRLFFDYLYDASKVKPFYGHNFREGAAFESVMTSIDGRMLDRQSLVATLKEQNSRFGSGEKAAASIALLAKPTTYAVVTGQQCTLFGGPAYTVFKTVTAIQLAARLKRKFPEKDFVPVFWIEGEDHDFAEMNHVALFDPEGSPARVEYLPGGVLPDRNVGPVGELVFDSTLNATFGNLEALLARSEFSPDLLMMLKECYGEGQTFGMGFARWMAKLFSEYGLVLMSPNDPRLKKLLTPLFVNEVTEYPRTSQLVIARSAELEESYHAQVKAKSVNLFLFHKGGRYPIEPREHDFSLRGTRHFVTREELLRIAKENPELLSPNVVLRPLAQDTLLPTVSYVAGPSEIAYYAQLTTLYEDFGLSMPVIYPRASATFVEERVVRMMEKYTLRLEDLFDDIEHIKSKVIEQIDEVHVDQIFEEASKSVHHALQELRFGVNDVDSTLLGPLDSVRSKFDMNLGVLKEKAIAAQKQRHEVAMRQIEKSVGRLLPGSILQERQVGTIYFMNKYGLELIQWLMGELDSTGFKHQLLVP